MPNRKICVVTGSRADYGLLYWLMKEIQRDDELQLQIIATGMHLSPEFGNTHTLIAEDGFNIDAKVEMQLSSDTPVAVTKSLGLGVIGFADVLDRFKPDIMVVLGDRYEILAAVEAALIARITVAHIAGGDVTEGAFDEAIRHSITKMSHLHFVTNELAYNRVRQMGESPEHIYNVGSPGIDQIKRLKLLSKDALAKVIDFKFQRQNLLITYHPVTLDLESPGRQFNEVLKALSRLGDEVGLIFTRPNSDTDGKIISQMIDDFVANKPNAKAYTSLGQNYLNVINHVDAVVGNSSSGLYEVPSFKKPTVNIGDRQKGRLLASSVINCEPKADDIYGAIRNAFKMNCTEVVNPYGDGDSSFKIVEIIKSIADPKTLLKKQFFEVK